MPRFSLRSFDAIGFDMDGVVAKYNFQSFLGNVYGLVVKYLVNKKGYSQELFPNFDKIKGFCTKGLVLDIHKGNVLKCGAQGAIFRATHGTQFLTQGDIKSQYDKGQWAPYRTIAKEIANRDNHVFVESLFELPIIYLFARLVDDVDKNKSRENYSLALKDIWQGLYHVYSPATEWPTDDVETYHEHAMAHPGEFVCRSTDSVRAWIKSLKQDGKTVFLLTSSGAPYTKALLQHCLGAEMEEYFDFHLCAAHKPKFFRPDWSTPFFEASAPSSGDLGVSGLEQGQWYRKGSLKHISQHLRTITGKENPKVVYFGDGLKNDILPAKRDAGWDTVFVLENMVADGMAGVEAGGDDRGKVLLPSDRAYLCSAEWGAYLSDEDESGVRHESLASALMRQHTDITVPLLDYLADLPLTAELEQFSPTDSSVSGYFPAKPLTCAH